VNEKARRLALWARGEAAPPMTVELNPTNRCNLKCLSCWQQHFDGIDYSTELSGDKLFSIVQEAGRLGVREFRIPGAGEPMVRSNLLDVLGEVKRQGMEGLLITNGTLFTEVAVAELVSLGWDCITFSIDGPDAETNDYLRGVPGTFERIVRSLEMFSREKERRGADAPFLRITTVLSNRNVDRVGAMVEFAARHGCGDLQIQPMTIWGDPGRALELDEAQRRSFQTMIPGLQARAVELGVQNNFGEFAAPEIVEQAGERMDEAIEAETAEFDDPFLSLPCFEPWYNMIILPDGKVGPCSMSGGTDGDDITDKGLEDVWFGDRLGDIRRRLLGGDLPPYCRRCCAIVHVENRRLRREVGELLNGSSPIESHS